MTMTRFTSLYWRRGVPMAITVLWLPMAVWISWSWITSDKFSEEGNDKGELLLEIYNVVPGNLEPQPSQKAALESNTHPLKESSNQEQEEESAQSERPTMESVAQTLSKEDFAGPEHNQEQTVYVQISWPSDWSTLAAFAEYNGLIMILENSYGQELARVTGSPPNATTELWAQGISLSNRTRRVPVRSYPELSQRWPEAHNLAIYVPAHTDRRWQEEWSQHADRNHVRVQVVSQSGGHSPGLSLR